MIKYPLIILAGGKSERMGKPKGLLKFNQMSWLEHQFYKFASCGGSTVYLVLGFDQQIYFETLPWLSSRKYGGLKLDVLINPEPQKGPFSSLVTAFKYLSLQGDGSCKAVFMSPIDVPIPHQVVFLKLQEHLDEDTYVCSPIFKATGGHPVLLSKVFIELLSNLNVDDKDARLDVQIQSLPGHQCKRLAVDDPQVTMNLNTPALWTEFSSFS